MKLVCFDNMSPNDFYDGIHFNHEGIRKFVKNFKYIVNPIIGVPLPEYSESKQALYTNTYKHQLQNHGNRKYGNSQFQNSGSRVSQGYGYNSRPNQHVQSRSFYKGYRNNQSWNDNRDHYADNNLYNLLELLLHDRHGEGFS